MLKERAGPKEILEILEDNWWTHIFEDSGGNRTQDTTLWRSVDTTSMEEEKGEMFATTDDFIDLGANTDIVPIL